MKRLCPQCRKRFDPPDEVCADDRTPLVEDRAGQSIGGCTLEELIGLGRLRSTVWEAARGDEPRVAVKVVPAADDEEREALQSAARSAAALRHANLVSIHGHGSTVDGHVYVVMELLEGVGLDERLSRAEPVPADEAVAIVDQLLDALNVAHRDGLPHLELAPADIFLKSTPDGLRVTVLDVGLFRPEPPPAPLAPSPEGAPAPALYYRAPELFVTGRGEAASDLYAVGAILVHLLTGRPPYAGNAADLGRAHLSRRPPRLTERGVDPALAESAQVVVDRLMAPQPADRYSSAAEARLAVGGLLAAPPPVVDDDGFLDEMEDSFQNLSQISVDPSADRAPVPPPPIDPSPGSGAFGPPPVSGMPARSPAPAPTIQPAPPTASGGGRWALVAVIALLAGVVIYLATRPAVVAPPAADAGTLAAVVDAAPPPPPPPRPDAAAPKAPVDADVAPVVDAALPVISRINSTPEGALLTVVGGADLGRTPFSGRLPKTATRIEVSLDGHATETIELSADALARGGQEQAVTLEKEPPAVDRAAVARWRARKAVEEKAKREAALAAQKTRDALAQENSAAAGAEPEPPPVGDPPEPKDPPPEATAKTDEAPTKSAGGLVIIGGGDSKAKGSGTDSKGPRVIKLGDDTPSPAGGSGKSKVETLQ